MLRLIVKIGVEEGSNNRFKEEETIDTKFKTFEMECLEFEELLVYSKSAGEKITLLGIEIFKGLPKPVTTNLPAVSQQPITTPLPLPSPAQQATLISKLKSKWHAKNGQTDVKPIALPG